MEGCRVDRLQSSLSTTRTRTPTSWRLRSPNQAPRPWPSREIKDGVAAPGRATQNHMASRPCRPSQLTIVSRIRPWTIPPSPTPSPTLPRIDLEAVPCHLPPPLLSPSPPAVIIPTSTSSSTHHHIPCPHRSTRSCRRPSREVRHYQRGRLSQGKRRRRTEWILERKRISRWRFCCDIILKGRDCGMSFRFSFDGEPGITHFTGWICLTWGRTLPRMFQCERCPTLC